MQPADRMLLYALRSAPWSAVALAVVSLADAAATLLFPAALGRAVDAAIEGLTSAAPLLVLVVLLGVSTGAEYCQAMLQGRISADVAMSMRKRLVRHLLALGVHAKRPTGDLLSRVLSGAGESATVVQNVVGLVVSLVTSVGAVVLLAVVDLRLLGFFLLATLAGLMLTRMFLRETTSITTRYQDLQGQIATRLLDAMAGIRTIRASGTVGREISRILAPLPNLSSAGQETWHVQRKAGWRMALIVPMLQITILGTAGVGVAEGMITPGELLATSGYLALAMGLLNQMLMFGEVGRARGAAARVAEVLEEPLPMIGRQPLQPGPGRLILQSVSVRIGDRRLLDSVDLDIPAGAVVAIVGRSGMGKSTLSAVAGGMLLPDGGDAILDGQRLRDVDPAKVRDVVTFAFERPMMLGDTVADMIGYGDAPASRHAVEQAARDCYAYDFITRLPQGFETPTAGLRLSGGELQRLGLARAAWRDARVVVLDDALSSLDMATESRIAAALQGALAGRTQLIIAHRPSTAARADLVAWLDEGRIRALDTHERLWANAAYRAMFDPANTSAVATIATEEG